MADTGTELPLKQMNTVTLLESGALKEELVANMKDTWCRPASFSKMRVSNLSLSLPLRLFSLPLLLSFLAKYATISATGLSDHRTGSSPPSSHFYHELEPWSRNKGRQPDPAPQGHGRKTAPAVPEIL